MKFNKRNLFHIFIYLYGMVIFNCILIYKKYYSKQIDERVILYGHKLYGNLKSLYKELEETDIEFYFLTLDYKVYTNLRSSSVNVLYGLKINHMLKVVFSKIVVTDHGLHFMKKLISQEDNYLFDANHGLPLEKWNENIMQQWYEFDEVWLFSNFHKDVYINDFGYKKDNLVITGYGRLDYLKRFNSSAKKLEQVKKIKHFYGLEDTKKVILYAPTWIHSKDKIRNEFMRPDNINFLKYLDQIGISNNLTILFRPHLNTILSNRVKKELDSFTNLLYFPFNEYEEVEDFLIISDLLITDWSSIALDYILLDRPTIFLNTPNSFKLGIFNEELLRFGKVSDQGSLEKNIIKYINNIDLYNQECPQQKRAKEIIYEGSSDLAGSTYLTRIKKYI